ncbi:MAG: ATP-binding cassette domain-containing protein, partial [Planctomycetes bacterium]|nr:ATP-binding cassette domain-containing protein [Planctomycetota bacterium]
VLQDITFEVRKGEVAAIVGESGAGKTTLLDLVPRFYDPQQGCIEVDGIDLRRIRRASLLDHIAVVTQQTFLFNRSIADNIRSGRKHATFEEVQEAAKVAKIHDFVVSLPQGYDTVVGELGVKLSGGQRQRIAIARAVLKNAAILILDEATSALDSESERQVQEALNNLMQGRTTFVIAHRLSTIQHADKIVVLKAGRIVEMGTHAQLLAANGEYRRLYQTQFGGIGGNPA